MLALSAPALVASHALAVARWLHAGLSSGALLLAAGFLLGQGALLGAAALILGLDVAAFLVASGRVLAGVPSTSPTIHRLKLALVGLGYVGMPIAVEFAKHVSVIGFNHNEHRIQQYKSGIDPTNEVGNEVISKTTVDFTSDEKRLAEAKFIIVAVPTPVKPD